MTIQKELAVRMQPNGRMYEIYYEGGGELPECLRSTYTTKRIARADLANYVNTKKKVQKNATSKKTGGTK